jgi:L-malate glycosyltransferase
MKICFISTLHGGHPWGGSEELWSRTAELAIKRGHHVTLVTSRWPEIPPRIGKLREGGAHVYRVTGLYAGPHLPVRLRRAFERFVHPWPTLESWKPDVICVSEASAFEHVRSWPVRRFLQKLGAPYVIICQHAYEDQRFYSDAARHEALAHFQAARKIAFVAERNLRVTERQLAIEMPNACVVHNPVNLTDFRPVPWPHSDVVEFASVARLHIDYKGQDVLLQTLGDHSWRQRRWRLRLYGDGSDRTYLERLAGYYGIANRVGFCGHVADIRSIWAENDLCLLASRSEGTPLSLVEAMISGRPSVVTDVGGNLEWIDEPSTGFIADAPSPRAFGNALERAWNARASWEQIGRRSHEVAMSKLDPNPEDTLLALLVEDRVPELSGRPVPAWNQTFP